MGLQGEGEGSNLNGEERTISNDEDLQNALHSKSPASTIHKTHLKRVYWLGHNHKLLGLSMFPFRYHSRTIPRTILAME